jgi:predicted naringenin-chalcone synthase
MQVYGIGTAVPEHHIDQMDSALIAHGCVEVPPDRTRVFDEIYRRSGVKKRHSVVLNASRGPLESRQTFYRQNPRTSDRMALYEAHAADLACTSARNAIESSGVEPSSISHIVSVSCTGFHSPGFDIALIRQLALNTDVARTHIGFMGCQGAMNALRVAHGFVASGQDAKVLLCATELCSLHQYSHWDTEKIVANALFADGSASVLLGAGKNPQTTNGLRMVGSGSILIDHSADAMSWKIADHGFEMTLSPEVPRLIASQIRPWMENWLSRFDLDLSSIRTWAVHPGGPRILTGFAEAIDIPKSSLDRSFEILADYGNMSSATILFIIKKIMESNPEPGFLVAVAFGPGLTVEAALFEIQ